MIDWRSCSGIIGAMPKSGRTQKDDGCRSLTSLRVGDITAPAAALMTLFCRGGATEDLEEGEFHKGLLRQLIQTLAASVFQPVALPEWSLDERDLYLIPSQLLSNLLDRWNRAGWLSVRAVPGRKRNATAYRVTDKGTAGLVTLIWRCEEGLTNLRLDQLLVAFFVAREFPLARLETKATGVGKHLGKDGFIVASDWKVGAMRRRTLRTLRAQEKTLEELIDDLGAATATLSSRRKAIRSLGDLNAVAQAVEVVNERGTTSYALGPRHWSPGDSGDGDLNFYFPGMFPFLNQRDSRSVEEAGIEPLLNFYSRFDGDFIDWHLFRGIEGIRSTVLVPHLAHVRLLIEIVEDLK